MVAFGFRAAAIGCFHTGLLCKQHLHHPGESWSGRRHGTRFLSAFADPVVGRLCDTTLSPIGARKTRILFGVVVPVICVWKPFATPPSAAIGTFH